MGEDEATATSGGRVRTDVGPHDHAWRRVRATAEDDGLMLGLYCCDLCSKTWAM